MMRQADPKVGDLMFWGEHVTVVVSVTGSGADLRIGHAGMVAMGFKLTPT